MEFPVLAVALAEFDVDQGNTLTQCHPPDFNVAQFEESQLADLCLPDGAHIHSSDWTYLILHPKKGTSSSFSSATPQQTAASDAKSAKEENHVVYGISLYKKRADKTTKRGAVQRAAVILCRIPAFETLEAVARVLVDQLLQASSDKAVLKKAFDSLKKAWDSGAAELSLFEQNIVFSPAWNMASSVKEKPLRFSSFTELSEGASLIELIQRFGVDTMFLWYTLLLEQRILFSGQPAHLVGRCCLASVLLVAPLSGFIQYIYPYVALTDLSALEISPTYIAGTTNQILETKTEWYDMMASFSTGIVRKSTAKMSSLDKEFILNVISGMHAGEKWVRDQFRNYTLNFLESVRTGSYMCAQHAALGEPFKLSPLYERYSAALGSGDAAEGSVASPSLPSGSSHRPCLAVLDELKSVVSESGPNLDLKKKQLLWELLQQLVDLSVINTVCEADGASVIAPLLDASSAQVRKYAVAVLAQLAISIKGQVSLVQNNLIPRVLVMLRDPMPNVASAAAYCLFKMSTLYIGVCALVQNRVPKMLLSFLCSEEDNLALKISATETLIQIHTLDSHAEVIGRDSVKHVLKQTSDSQFRSLLAQLLDLWGEERVVVKISDGMQVTLASLRAPSMEVRSSATSMLLSDISQDAQLTLELVAAGGVQLVIANAQTARTEPLARLSMAILCVVADTSMGRQAILGNKILEIVLGVLEIPEAEFPLYLYYVLRFCEVCCQHIETTKRFLALDGVSKMIAIVQKYADRSSLRTLLLPPLGAFKALLLLNPPLRVNLAPKWAQLPEIYQRVAESAGRGGSSASSQTAQMAEEVLALLRSLIDLTDPQVAKRIAAAHSLDLETDMDSDSPSLTKKGSRRLFSVRTTEPNAEGPINTPSQIEQQSTPLLDSLDDEIDNILAGNAGTTRQRSATIAMNSTEAKAAAAALNINVDELDHFVESILANAGSAESAPGPKEPELEHLADALLADLAPQPRAMEKLDDGETSDGDDIDKVGEMLLMDHSSTKPDKPQLRKVVHDSSAAAHSPKWDDLDSLTNDLLLDVANAPTAAVPKESTVETSDTKQAPSKHERSVKSKRHLSAGAADHRNTVRTGSSPPKKQTNTKDLQTVDELDALAEEISAL